MISLEDLASILTLEQLFEDSTLEAQPPVLPSTARQRGLGRVLGSGSYPRPQKVRTVPTQLILHNLTCLLCGHNFLTPSHPEASEGRITTVISSEDLVFISDVVQLFGLYRGGLTSSSTFYS